MYLFNKVRKGIEVSHSNFKKAIPVDLKLDKNAL